MLSWSAPALASYNATTHTYEWTDDLRSTQTAGVTGDYDQSPKVQTKAAHMLELKDAIDQVAPLCGASNIWTAYDLQVLSQVRIGSKVSKEQLNTLRKGIRSLYSAKSQTAPSSVADLNTNTPTRIQKSHIQDMRDAMTALIPVCLASSGAVCGNGVKEGTEQCDQGAANGVCPAGCSNTCTMNSCGANCWNMLGNSMIGTTGFPPGDCTAGMIGTTGVVRGASCPAFDTCSTVTDIMQISGECIAGSGICPGPVDTTVTSYFQCGACSTPVCGNGVIETGETCDDSNTVNGDGCSSSCQNETCVVDGDPCGIPGQEALCQVNCCSHAYEMRGELSSSGDGTLPMAFGLYCAAVSTCSDGIQNQGETGVDCGGPCAACASSGCTIRHPIGWSGAINGCAEFFRSANDPLPFATTHLDVGQMATANAIYCAYGACNGQLTYTCDPSGAMVVISSNCDRGQIN